MDKGSLARFNFGMARCSSCNGLITRQDVVCYICGDKLPKGPKRSQLTLPATSKPHSALTNLMFGASLGLTGFSMLSSHKLPLWSSLALSGLFLLPKAVVQCRKQFAKMRSSSANNSTYRRAAFSGSRS
jgi:hypothetical protein